MLIIGTWSTVRHGLAPIADGQSKTNSKFVQHTIEKSNVRGVVEITRMIELSRTYSQVATILQQQSEMRTGAISKLADVPA